MLEDRRALIKDEWILQRVWGVHGVVYGCNTLARIYGCAFLGVAGCSVIGRWVSFSGRVVGVKADL